MSLFSSSLCYYLAEIKWIKTNVPGPPLSYDEISWNSFIII